MERRLAQIEDNDAVSALASTQTFAKMSRQVIADRGSNVEAKIRKPEINSL
jgi:hypothetical protein